jgi:hypothetical protein
MEISLQTASGSFLLKNFISHDLYLLYGNLTNVVVRLSPSDAGSKTIEKITTKTEVEQPDLRDPQRNALLISSHYDSMYPSPGMRICKKCNLL